KKNLRRHKRKSHRLKPNAPSPTLKPKLSDLSVTERRRQLNKIFGPDHEESNDVVDKGLVISGGGYGLGKNRKHQKRLTKPGSMLRAFGPPRDGVICHRSQIGM